MNCIVEKASLRITKAKNAPKRDETEKITPVCIEPISLNAKRNNKIENAILKAPTVNMYGIEAKVTLKPILSINDVPSKTAPPIKHFKPVIITMSRFLLRNLLRLLSIPQNKQAPIISKLPLIPEVNESS